LTGVTGQAAPTERKTFSIEALRESRSGRAAAGAVLAGVTAALVWAIVSAFTGSFTDVLKIRAELPPGSNAVTVAAPVEYLNVTVGKVGSEAQGPNGDVQVQLQIYPRALSHIPKGVEAQVAPLSIFGNQYVNLVRPATIGSGHLGASDFISPYVGAPSTSLQGTVTQLYDLLNAVHPADLDTALTAFAQALNGEGTALGHALAGSGKYLGTAVVPNLANVNADIGLLTPVNNEIDRSAANLLATLSNSATTGQTITQQESALKSLLTQGTAAIEQFSGVLNQVQGTLPRLLNESGPLLADVTRSPDGLSRTLSGLTQFAAAVAAQEQGGPFLAVHAALPVANISAGVNAALGYQNPASVDAALGSAVNPRTYTSADCPQYPGETNPFCGVGGSTDAVPAGGNVGTVHSLGTSAGSSQPTAPAPTTGSPPQTTVDLLAAASSDPTLSQMAAVQQIATALDGGTPPAIPALATIVLLPLLSSMSGS
jgi:phospholipid/cholesterol/gamma-HCH transport system substrate-binding protein